MKYSVQDRIGWLAFRLTQITLGHLPWRAASAIGAGLGEIAYRLGHRRRVISENLETAFPDWTKEERERVVHGTFIHAYRNLAECFQWPSLTRERMSRVVEGVEGFEHAEQIGAGHNPSIVLTGHMGNWELMGAYFGLQGYRPKVFAKPLHNPLVEADLLRTRRSYGLDVIYTGEGLRPALRHLREGGMLVFLADQDARREGIAVPFFGVPASTAMGPAVFAWLAQVPILPVFSVRRPGSRHHFVIMPPIKPVKGEAREAAIERLTRAHVEALERIIRQYPDQYFWFHRRWKTPPEKLAPGKRLT